MANPKHVDLLRQSAEAWNRYREDSGDIPDLIEADLSDSQFAGADLRGALLVQAKLHGADLRECNFAGAHIPGADLVEANLSGADLRGAFCDKANFLGADLSGADLRGTALIEACLTGVDLTGARFDRQSVLSDAELMEAKLPGVDLAGANLSFTDLRKADLKGATLRGTDLVEAVLTAADLTDADLSGADLTGAALIRTTVEGARFTGARIYGVSVWSVKGTPEDKSDLVVTSKAEPTVTVGDLEVAQFVHLLINNVKIRDFIDTVAAKAVLILGRFTDERKSILDAIRELLSHEDYVPIVFDFDKPSRRDLMETVSTLAHMCRFIIADFTDPRSIPQELATIIPHLPSVPVQPILLAGETEWEMGKTLRRTGRVLETFRYTDLADVERHLRERILEPPERWLAQFAGSQDPLTALREKERELQARQLENERLREELRRLRSQLPPGGA